MKRHDCHSFSLPFPECCLSVIQGMLLSSLFSPPSFSSSYILEMKMHFRSSLVHGIARKMHFVFHRKCKRNDKNVRWRRILLKCMLVGQRMPQEDFLDHLGNKRTERMKETHTLIEEAMKETHFLFYSSFNTVVKMAWKWEDVSSWQFGRREQPKRFPGAFDIIKLTMKVDVRFFFSFFVRRRQVVNEISLRRSREKKTPIPLFLPQVFLL